ncbi:hypothetical protein ACFL6C_04485 [Myxococcota bacterium]
MRFFGCALALSIVAVMACEDSEPPPTVHGTDTGTISVRNVDGTSSLFADGATWIQLQITALDPNREPDDSSMTLSTSSGFVSDDVDSPSWRPSLVLSPRQGTATIGFICQAGVGGPAALSIETGHAEGSFVVDCQIPPEALVVDLDTSDCADGLRADGFTWCEVAIAVGLEISGTSYPPPQVTMTASAVSAAGVILPDGSIGANSDGVLEVLSSSPTGSLGDTITVITDNLGAASFYVVSPVPNLRQTVRIEVGGSVVDGSLVPTSTILATFRDEENLAELHLTAASTILVAGGVTTLSIQATDPAGNPAGPVAGLDNRVFLESSDAEALLDPVVPTLSDGLAQAQVTAPQTVGDEIPRVVTIMATYRPLPYEDALTDTVRLQIYPEGALLLDVAIDSTEFRSDADPFDPASHATIVVTQTKDGQPRSFPVRFAVDAPDYDRIGFGVPPNLTVEEVVTPDASNEASVIIYAQSPRVRGPAMVTIEVLDTGEAPPVLVSTTMEFNVDRDPLLQALIFMGAQPNTIGVLGSALQSSSLVSFQVLNDLTEPMANVRISFDVPAVADPQASVVPANLTDTTGIASTIVSAGRLAAPLVVRATVTVGDNTLSVLSDPIAVVGGLPNFANTYYRCDTCDVIQVGAAEATCRVGAADRFTNAGPDGLAVQFRAESSAITASSVMADGNAAAQLVFEEPGGALADVRDWSYGLAIPNSPADLVTQAGDSFDPVACFDGTTATPCDLYSMCREGHMPAYCPLPVDFSTGIGCWETIPVAGLDLMGLDTGACTRTPVGADLRLTCLDDDDTDIIVPGGTLNGLVYATAPEVKAVVDDLISHARDCGFPVSCLTGLPDFDFVLTDEGDPTVPANDWPWGDECVVAAGCFDFDSMTPCPHSGLVTVAATLRGEEGFDDLNGNGIFDFVDTNGNHRHDFGEPALEPWTDLPEPYLDKNDNCSLDDFSFHPRYEPFEEIRLSDLYSDEDGSDDFGYLDPAGSQERVLTNGRWDSDKEISVQARVVILGDIYYLHISEECDVADVLLGEGGYTCRSNGTASTCVQVGVDYGMAFCMPPRLVHPFLIANDPGQYGSDIFEFLLDWVWTDKNSNCFNPHFEQVVRAEGVGQIVVKGGSVGGDIVPTMCGISDTGSGRRNPYRPWCEDYPDLGAITQQSFIGLDCIRSGIEHGVRFTHSNGAIFFIPVEPVCN